jgi:uncharacterized membrane protein YuzA (DUF378 family)
MAKKMATLEWIVYILVIVGALNYGIAGLFTYDILGMIFGGIPILMKIVAILIGLAGLYLIYMLTKK